MKIKAPDQILGTAGCWYLEPDLPYIIYIHCIYHTLLYALFWIMATNHSKYRVFSYQNRGSCVGSRYVSEKIHMKFCSFI